jgi:hypothetical protein
MYRLFLRNLKIFHNLKRNFKPYSQKSLSAFLKAAVSFQCRTRAARVHEDFQGRNESDSQYYKRIQRETRLSNVTVAELRTVAEEYVKSDNSLKFP